MLIGGSTSYDANDNALVALLDEWGDDADYIVRVGRLRTGTGATGIQLAAGMTVFDDGDTDRLTGTADLDWFFLDPLDIATDFHQFEEGN